MIGLPADTRGVRAAAAPPQCRSCGASLRDVFVDLGMSPLCESFLTREALRDPETFYPLTVYVCSRCFLVQLEEFVSPEEIFSEYAYFSAYSDSWLAHSARYAQRMCSELSLNSESLVVELASNDGYLLQYFVQQGIPVLGIEPAANVARAAAQRDVPTMVEFFGTSTARSLAAEDRLADLVVANNVLAQVPDLNDFLEGIRLILKGEGTCTVEFPHLLELIDENQFDTIYHEHFSYFGFLTAQSIFAAHGLTIYDVERLPTHGGSLRVFARHASDSSRPVTSRVTTLAKEEQDRGLDGLDAYLGFDDRVRNVKRDLVGFLIRARERGRTVAAYGAPGKGNTLLNYCGIRSDLIDYAVDRNPYKHGRYTPGTHIPIYPPERLRQTRPDFVVVLPWNLKDEILTQLEYVREWGGQFVVPIPRVQVL